MCYDDAVDLHGEPDWRRSNWRGRDLNVCSRYFETSRAARTGCSTCLPTPPLVKASAPRAVPTATFALLLPRDGLDRGDLLPSSVHAGLLKPAARSTHSPFLESVPEPAAVCLSSDAHTPDHLGTSTSARRLARRRVIEIAVFERRARDWSRSYDRAVIGWDSHGGAGTPSCSAALRPRVDWAAVIPTPTCSPCVIAHGWLAGLATSSSTSGQDERCRTPTT